jgi:hypothetical protein
LTNPDMTISIRWIPGKMSFQPLERLQTLAVEATAHAVPDLDLTTPTPTALKIRAKQKALTEWEQVWLDDPCTNPAYRALHHPPSLEPPDFIKGVGTASRTIFCTAVRLLTEHAFTGEYNARHRPWAPDPHNCECPPAPLQTPTHAIFHCEQTQDARERLLRPVSETLSPNIIFCTKARGEALAAFIKQMQICIRPRRGDPIPEDHG